MDEAEAKEAWSLCWFETYVSYFIKDKQSFHNNINWYNLSSHDNLMIGTVMKYIDKYPWDWKGISANPNLILEWIQTYPNNPWNWSSISFYNKNTTTEWLPFLPNNLNRWDVGHFYANLSLNITLDDIHDFPNIPWDWHYVSRNKNITIEWLEKYQDSVKYCWNWKQLSKHPNLTFEWLVQFPDKSWHWGEICRQPELLPEWFITFPDLCKSLPMYHCFLIEWIIKYPDLPWGWDVISYKHITLDLLKMFPDKHWTWHSMHHSQNIKLEWLQTFPDNSWNWPMLSCHKNLTLQWLRSFPDKPWNAKSLSRNKNLTYDWIKYNPQINWDITKMDVVTNHRKNRNYFFERHKAATLIQQQWKQCRYNPEYKICRNIIEKEYDELGLV